MIYDNFIQVLLFRDERDSYRVGPALWAALKEVSALYNFDQKRANFQRCFLSEWIPPEIDQEVEIDQQKVKETLSSREWWKNIRTSSAEVSSKLFSDEEQYGIQETLDQSDPAENILYDLVTDESHDTVDKRKLVRHVRKLLGNVPASIPLLIVTDQELMPPDSWNYIIWDNVGKHSVFVSTKPTDPRYWGMKTARLNAVIKQRIRAACCSGVGEILGFKRCSNPGCFLYSPILSVSDLDEMNHFGEEHEVPKLSGMGYEVEQDEEMGLTIAPLVHFGLL